jgi:hypothetical protein
MRRNRSAVTSSISKLIDAVMDGYVSWREECAAVHAAYREWLRAGPARRALAFEDYRAALDREERAASEYQRLLAIAQSATA